MLKEQGFFSHIVKCPGYGKCRCDAEEGCHKSFCNTAFGMCVLVPGQEMKGNWWVPSHKVEDGHVVILATTVQHILQDCDYVKGACRNSARQKKDSKNIIFELRFLLRERGEAKMMGMKIEAIGFGKRKYMGLWAHHNFVVDPDIPEYTVMARQMPCLCNGCQSRLKKHVDERYLNPCDDCQYYHL
jgi:hypothetical protein